MRAGSPVVDKGDPLTSTGDDRNGDGRAFDGDGNGSPVPDMGAYELRDITAPVTTFTARPPGWTNDNTPVFQFRSEDGARFECRLDGGAFQPCTSPTTTTALPDGPHSLTVRATDRVFNGEANPPTAGFTVDTVAPDTRFTKKAPKRFFKKKVKFKFAATEAGRALPVQARRPGLAQLRLDVQVRREARQAHDPRAGRRPGRQHRQDAGALQVQAGHAAPLTSGSAVARTMPTTVGSGDGGLGHCYR